jgi:hypothetical protein
MAYEGVSPSTAEAVVVEWLDITGDPSTVGLTRRWTLAYLLSSTHISNGIKCHVFGTTWDEDFSWTDINTIPEAVIVCETAVAGEDDDDD